MSWYRADAGPKGWKAAGKIFSLKVDGEDLYPDYVLDEKARPLTVVRLILALLKERKALWGLAIWFGSANRRLRGGRPKDLLVSKSELVLMAAQDEVESGDIDFFYAGLLMKGQTFLAAAPNLLRDVFLPLTILLGEHNEV